MCNGGIDYLPLGVKLRGVILRKETGYCFYRNVDVTICRQAAALEPRFGPIEEVVGDEREELRARVKALNAAANLPGVGVRVIKVA